MWKFLLSTMASGGAPTLELQFLFYAKFNDPTSDGKRITLTNTDYWLKQAELLDGAAITHTDTGVCFNKFRTRTISYPEFVRFLDDLSKYKSLDISEMKQKLIECGLPGAKNKKGKGRGDDSDEDDD